MSGIMELKIHEDDQMLLQGLRYFDYVNENLDAIKNMVVYIHHYLEVPNHKAIA